jgi:3-hydroxyacyl-CoA dehydrogenase
MGYLSDSDVVVFNPYELLHVAKVEARAMFDAGYRAPMKSWCRSLVVMASQQSARN